MAYKMFPKILLPSGRQSSITYSPYATSLAVVGGLIGVLLGLITDSVPAVASQEEVLEAQFAHEIRPIVKKYCADCHEGPDAEAELDLVQFQSYQSARQNVAIWLRVREMLESRQMPPPEAPQPPDKQRDQLRGWVRAVLRAEALRHAGDPGHVPLRRLNNAEYNYTIQDLTGVPTLTPADDFPADGAAGEGFSNTGLALAMSPALLEKYVEAAKSVAAHAVLTPEGVRFSPSVSRRDWTNEILEQIRTFYARYTSDGGGVAVNLQGIQFTTNQGGRLPVEKYFEAIAMSESALAQGEQTIDQVAANYHLNPKYHRSLWHWLSSNNDQGVLLNQLREKWQRVSAEERQGLAEEVTQWQRALWRQNPVGHIVRHLGGTAGPAAWLEPVTPLVEKQELRIPIPDKTATSDMTLHLVVLDAGDGNADEFVLWENPRIVRPGQPDLLLRDIPRVTAQLDTWRKKIAQTASACLSAVAETNSMPDDRQLTSLSDKYRVPKDLLRAWFLSLGFHPTGTPVVGYITDRAERIEGYDFVQGWVGENALSVVANSSGQQVRIPGRLAPHSVAVHPTPNRRVAVAWQSPEDANIDITAQVVHAHPECGNGTTWSLELRRGKLRKPLDTGLTNRESLVVSKPAKIFVRKGDLIVLSIGPRDGNHFCDLTSIELAITGTSFRWSLAEDVAPNILAGNPHPDRSGRPDVWHFFSEPDQNLDTWAIPDGCLVDQWLREPDPNRKQELAAQVQQLLESGPDAIHASQADRHWYQQWTSSRGPLLSLLREVSAAVDAPSPVDVDSPRPLFGIHPAGKNADDLKPADLCLPSPSRIELSLPTDLVARGELVTTVRLHSSSAPQAAVQVYAGWESGPKNPLVALAPVVARPDSPAWKRWEESFEQMRQLFPPALCYTQIVPVDEVITLNLFYREDDHLKRLMLTTEEVTALDRLWDELWYVSQEPLQLAAAYEQLVEYATQDRPDKVAELRPLRPAIQARVARYTHQQRLAEPRHLAWVIQWANRAFRRPLRADEVTRLRQYYSQLRNDNIDHEEAIRLLIARILSSPAFLYRIEESQPEKAIHPVSDYELASRLSYFLWSSMPDEALWEDAACGRLHEPDVLKAHMARMLKDAKIRRLAEQFAAHWLQVYEFDQHNEKSERHFPEFAELRSDMYEEFLQFFTHLFRDNGSILDVIGADYTFVNGRLAAFYGIPGVEGPAWRRITDAAKWHRGGILTQAAVLSKQAGASRTSPILRGAWISEVLLGEKLPKPPKNVPQLSETAPPGLTERQLIERHSRDPACARCHARIDPLGFALENYDAIGRYRSVDAGGLVVDTRTTLMDGTRLDGLDDLRRYLLEARRADCVRQFNRKLLGYALGRSVELSDEPLLEDIERELENEDFRVWKAIEKIILSPQFRMRRGG
ncbi:MAG: hypothetical protein KatS3mg110_0243 [Pirellulaceae bacterium]|nr:MAG: hypothetical protein KatS3mg110_0243 [Pirellulaceae bacterium]